MQHVGNSVPFSMRMEADLNTALKEEAEMRDRPASYLVSKAVKEFLRREKEERAILLERLQEADKGVFVSEERVTEWVNSWFTDSELPMPEADIFPPKN